MAPGRRPLFGGGGVRITSPAVVDNPAGGGGRAGLPPTGGRHIARRPPGVGRGSDREISLAALIFAFRGISVVVLKNITLYFNNLHKKLGCKLQLLI